MARLIDDLRAPGAKWAMPHVVAPEHEEEWKRYTVFLQRSLAMPELAILLIDNVAEYYFTASDQEFWDLRDHFPNLAPPYKFFWTEHKLPKVIHSKEYGDTTVGDVCPKGRVGALFHAIERHEWKGEGIPDNARWILWADLFIDYNKRECVADCGHGAMFFAIDAEGVLIEVPWLQSFAPPELNEVMKAYITWLHPSLLAVSFLHCKNVRVDENRPPAPLAKKYRAKHGVEPVVYKTLVIEPLKQILRKEGGAGSNGAGLTKAMHICRGHFADYREGRGLFGKYHGRYWIPQTVRGSRGGTAPAPKEIEVRV